MLKKLFLQFSDEQRFQNLNKMCKLVIKVFKMFSKEILEGFDMFPPLERNIKLFKGMKFVPWIIEWII